MLNLLSAETIASLPTLEVPGLLPSILPASVSQSEEGRGCHGCQAYRPAPQPSGNLQVDPDIHLSSPGMDVDLAYFYNATATNNGPFGYGRSLVPSQTAQASGSPLLVTLTRGDGSMATFTETGSKRQIATTFRRCDERWYIGSQFAGSQALGRDLTGMWNCA